MKLAADFCIKRQKISGRAFKATAFLVESQADKRNATTKYLDITATQDTSQSSRWRTITGICALCHFLLRALRVAKILSASNIFFDFFHSLFFLVIKFALVWYTFSFGHFK